MKLATLRFFQPVEHIKVGLSHWGDLGIMDSGLDEKGLAKSI